mmetsp:Transcript_19811/g.37820  ORF Transcript_19811/g.37820 Transcript_19811/m.37820 type:complete len:157 (-) Transcript_19811:107-577(-)|eukprot:CAMPEP_0114250428 /NCGR_PEP_ID=MMETSP0058-20121206/14692_1 /TAXON_ID=36894 /ORGANISM="Pyramimonas parkeae, CCMP726" /LENGTH=156 /DNA_ID=CAMNT_0001364083 /DNA_START=157 /DNA_END=627 /DNA_ORIENTATION=+
MESKDDPAAEPNLEAQLVKALCKVQELELQVQNFTEDSQQVLFERINGFVESLDDVRKSASTSDVEIPVELLQFVDEGINPDLFTAGRFEECICNNQKTKGKVEVLRKFHTSLLEEARKEFSDEMDAHLTVKAEDTTDIAPAPAILEANGCKDMEH